MPNVLAGCPGPPARLSCHCPRPELGPGMPCTALRRAAQPAGSAGRILRPCPAPAHTSGRQEPQVPPKAPGAAGIPRCSGHGTPPAPRPPPRRPRPTCAARPVAGPGERRRGPAIGSGPRRPHGDRRSARSVPAGPAPPRLYNGHPHGRGGEPAAVAPAPPHRPGQPPPVAAEPRRPEGR